MAFRDRRAAHRDKNLTVLGVVDLVVSGVDGPKTLSSDLLAEASESLGGDLVDQSLGRGDVDDHSIVRLAKNTLHGGERDEAARRDGETRSASAEQGCRANARLSGRGGGDDEHRLVGVDLVENLFKVRMKRG